MIRSSYVNSIRIVLAKNNNMSSFHERQKSLFNTLKAAEDQCSFSKTNKPSESPDYGTIDRQAYRRLKYEMRQFRGKESIYKRAEAKIQNCLRAKTLPDHIKNPQKYVHYSLSDVTPDQMSDSTNTSTALAFLRQLEEQNEIQEQSENDMDTDGVFKKPTFNSLATIKKQNIEDKKVSFKSSKVIMPEYVVGVTQKKVKKEVVKTERKNSNDNDKKVELKLEHLYTEDD